MVLPSLFGRCGIVIARATVTTKSSRENALAYANARLITLTLEQFQVAFHECLEHIPIKLNRDMF
jgi:hypothetical protein